MYCQQCGAFLSENTRFCGSCGIPQNQQPNTAELNFDQSLVGFSSKINDPAFKKYIKNYNRWSVIFTVIVAVAAVVGFTIAGEMGVDGMGNPESLYIGLAVGGMFIVIAISQIKGRKRSSTWDGTVVDKKVRKKTERQFDADNDYNYNVDYLEYSVVIRSDHGKTHVLKDRNNDTLYNYYRVGDRLRYHAGLKSYEKYDKSADNFIICNACASLNDIHYDYCFRCKCPLLK